MHHLIRNNVWSSQSWKYFSSWESTRLPTRTRTWRFRDDNAAATKKESHQPLFSAGFNFSLWGGATILQRLQGFCFCKLIRIETLAWHSISDCYLQTVVEIQDPPDVFNAVLYYPLLPVKEWYSDIKFWRSCLFVVMTGNQKAIYSYIYIYIFILYTYISSIIYHK